MRGLRVVSVQLRVVKGSENVKNIEMLLNAATKISSDVTAEAVSFALQAEAIGNLIFSTGFILFMVYVVYKFTKH